MKFYKKSSVWPIFMNGAIVTIQLPRGAYRVVYSTVDFAEFGIAYPTVAMIAPEGPDNDKVLNIQSANQPVTMAEGVPVSSAEAVGYIVDYEGNTAIIPIAPWSGILLLQRVGHEPCKE